MTTTHLPTQEPAPTPSTADNRSGLVNARLAGLLYLVIIVTGIFSAVVRSRVTVSGDAAATAANLAGDRWIYRTAFATSLALILSEAVLTVILYYLLRPVSRAGSLLAAAIRLVSLPIYATGLLCMIGALAAATEADYLGETGLALFLLSLHDYGYAIGLTFFALNCFVMSYLLIRSHHVPTVLGILLGIGGVGYLVFSLAQFFSPANASAATAVLLPALVAEVWFTVLLLVKGGGAGQWAEPVH